jgi:hypothetical protein
VKTDCSVLVRRLGLRGDIILKRILEKSDKV